MFEFSALTNKFSAPSNRLYECRESLLRKGKTILDLVSGNVTGQGIQFPTSILESALQTGLKKSKVYKPEPLGHLAARQAISRYYAKEKLRAPADQIVLTPGTSISYWYVFKILANPGDEILVPAPSYPLFDSIADLCDVRLIPYGLRDGLRWSIDFGKLESHINARTKAIVLISPHNPTGSVASDAEVLELASLSARRNLAIISDEVFSPFVYSSARLARPAATTAPLVLTLNGLSKMLALPGMKIGWIYVSGEKSLVQRSVKTLDMISDTFLPVNEVAQAAVPTLLSKSQKFQSTYITEMKKRRDLASTILGATPPEGGFFMTLRLPESLEEETVACNLLEKHHFLVHPGYFYDMVGQHIVFSFASRPQVLRKACERIKSIIL